MESAYKKLVFVALLLATLAIGSEALFGSGQKGICGISKEGLTACQASVSGLNPVPPSALCCSALSFADFHCLCFFKGSNLLTAYGVDPNLAMQLPAKCNLGQSIHC